MNCTKFRLL